MVNTQLNPKAVYSLRASPGETERLHRQADELLVANSALVDRTMLGPGDAAIDFGCGPRGILDLLSSRVGPQGRVVGVDADPNHVALASDLVARRSLDNVEVLLADARDTGLPSAAFDVTQTRTLLVTIPRPDEVVREMVRVTNPGGWVLSFEPDAGPESGLVDVQVESRADSYPAGHTRRTIRLDLLRAVRAQLVELGLCTDAEFDGLLAAAGAHLDNPATVVLPHFWFLVSGRKRNGR